MTETNGHYDPEILRAMLPPEAYKNVSFGWSRDEMKTLLQTIGRYIASQTRPLQKQIEELKAQVDELKRKGISYKGVYQKSCAYAVGDMVSYDHSVWCCIQVAQAGESPGAFPSQWQMALRGDGRDVPRQPTRGVHHSTIVERRT